MRLGAKRRIYIRSSRVNRKKISGFLILVLFVSMVAAGTLYFLKLVRPLLIDLAENQTKVIAEQAAQRAVNQLFLSTSYNDFITLSRLEDGTVSAVESNMAGVNRLKAEAAIAIQEAIDEAGETEISIPLGSVTGCALFAGLGPRMPVKLVPYGRTVVEFSSEFTEAGINQTHLEISLMAKSYVNIIMPGSSVASEIETELPVVQTILLGKIPENYVNIDRYGEEYEGDVLDIMG